MTQEERLQGLLERVEAAEGPDRGIDGRLALYEGWAFHFGDEYHDDWPRMGGHWLAPESWLHTRSPFDCLCRTDTFFDEPPDYTASVDSALALVERLDFSPKLVLLSALASMENFELRGLPLAIISMLLRGLRDA